ncbi:hypothetical protein GQ457_08G013580 [Hibiscus cannabinus]
MSKIAASESENSENGIDRSGRLILFNPINKEALVIQGSNVNHGRNPSHRSASSFGGGYIMGPGCNLLLQYLSENDPNQYGTPPAQTEAVEALPTVSIKDNLQCSVCLEDIKIGTEAKEMPCKHKFHDGCIVPRLELHSSCPVFRFQLPLDYMKIESNANRNAQRLKATVFLFLRIRIQNFNMF